MFQSANTEHSKKCQILFQTYNYILCVYVCSNTRSQADRSDVWQQRQWGSSGFNCELSQQVSH